MPSRVSKPASSTSSRIRSKRVSSERVDGGESSGWWEAMTGPGSRISGSSAPITGYSMLLSCSSSVLLLSGDWIR